MKRTPLTVNPQSIRDWQQRTQRAMQQRERETPNLRKPLAKTTAKRATQNREYSAKRKIFLEANPYCQKCGNTATECHHSKGRTGNLLTDERFFVAVCHDCHVWITANFIEACALGLSATRFNHEELT